MEASRVIVEETQLYKIVVSFGSVTSSVSLPCYMSHASIPAEVRRAMLLPPPPPLLLPLPPPLPLPLLVSMQSKHRVPDQLLFSSAKLACI